MHCWAAWANTQMNNAIEMLIAHTEQGMKERKSTFMSDTVGAAAAE